MPTRLLAPLAFLVMLLPTALLAQSDGVTTALNILEYFHKEATTLMAEPGLSGPLEAERETTRAELRQVRITAQPGPRRSERVYGLMSGYMDRALVSIEAMKSGADARRADELEAGIKRLKEQRAGMLGRLRKALDAESPAREKRPSELPLSLDPTPPHENPTPPGGPPGILYR